MEWFEFTFSSKTARVGSPHIILYYFKADLFATTYWKRPRNDCLRNKRILYCMVWDIRFLRIYNIVYNNNRLRKYDGKNNGVVGGFCATRIIFLFSGDRILHSIGIYHVPHCEFIHWSYTRAQEMDFYLPCNRRANIPAPPYICERKNISLCPPFRWTTKIVLEFFFSCRFFFYLPSVFLPTIIGFSTRPT